MPYSDYQMQEKFIGDELQESAGKGARPQENIAVLFRTGSAKEDKQVEMLSTH